MLLPRLSLAPALVAFAALVSLAPLAWGAPAQTELVFTEYQFNNPKIKAVRLDGTNLHELFTIPSFEWLPLDVEIDAGAGVVYWGDSASPSAIYSANLDGSSLTLVLGVAGSVRGPDLDGLGRMVYTAGNTIRRANTNGSGDQLLFTGMQSSPLGEPLVDRTNGHVYFGADNRIRRMNLDGSGIVTVVSGLTTPRSLELDVAGGYVYWLDANTISDYVGRARLDGTEFTVLIDNSPGVVQSSGLISLLLEPAGGQLYYANDLNDTIRRANLDGSGDTPFYTSPAGLSPSGLTLDSGRPAQIVADCNGNQVPDATDIAGGSSLDCNANGVPDECEARPCPNRTLLLDQGSNPAPASRTVGGPSANPGSRFEVLQPFDVPPGGWTVGELGLDGWTSNYGAGGGFTATLFPDDGTGQLPDETTPLASAVFQYRFDTDNVNWEYRALTAQLPPGRHWLRLSANDITYHGAANVGTSGLSSRSRSGLGNLFSASPIGLQVVEAPCVPAVSYCTSGTTSNGCRATMGGSGTPSLSNAGPFTLTAAGVEGSRQGLVFYGISGRKASHWGQGTSWLCVKAPTQRTPVGSSGGTAGACDGSLALDWNAWVAANPNKPMHQALAVGTAVDAQVWFRDPPAPKTTSLSDALEFTLCP